MEEDNRSVLCADVGALPVQCCGIVHLPKQVQQLLVAHDSRVERELNDLGVTCAVSAHVVVRGIVQCSTLIAGRRIEDAGNLPEFSLNTPKTSCTEGRFFCHSFLLPYRL